MRHYKSVDVLAVTIASVGDGGDGDGGDVRSYTTGGDPLAALPEAAHVFRLLERRKTPWVCFEHSVALLKWHTAHVPGKGRRP